MKEMKNNFLNITTRWRHHNVFFISLFICGFLVAAGAAFAQDTKDSTAKLSFNMSVGSKISDGIRTVNVFITRKENKKTIIVDDLKSPLNLYLNEVKDYDPAAGAGWMSKTYLSEEGTAEFKFPSWFGKLADSVHEYTFIVKAEADPKYENAEEQITVTDARVKIEYAGEDSVKTATATLYGWKDGALTPVPDAELKLCIKRTFNFLPFGEAEATTNENGEITGELPLDIPGNANGTLTIAGRLEEDARYGTVEFTKDVSWAVLPKTSPPRGRTLWSGGDNAPLVLVISSVTIIGVIWGTIFYLIYLLFKIKRLGKAT